MPRWLFIAKKIYTLRAHTPYGLLETRLKQTSRLPAQALY